MAAATPDEGGGRAHEFFDHVRALLGERCAELRFDDDRGLRVTVIDLNATDVTAIGETASRIGIGDERVRIERAEPADLETWERLRHELVAIQRDRPAAILMGPTPAPGYRRPPVQIDLAATEEGTAAALHAGYGTFVALRVGALPYPPGAEAPSRGRPVYADDRRERVDPGELDVSLDGALTVRSGATVTHGLLVTNVGEHDLALHTNGMITARILDDAGEQVGGFAGAQHVPLVIFTVAPGETVRVPLVVGTASFRPELGYAVPPGGWQLVAPIDLADGRRLVTPPLAFTITDA